MTAGTIFDRTRTPLTVWFTAGWLFGTQKDGNSAQSLQRSLEIGSYPTAWAMLHRLRSVLADGSAGSLHLFVTGAVEPGSTVITDAWQGYRRLEAKVYVRQPVTRHAALTPENAELLAQYGSGRSTPEAGNRQAGALVSGPQEGC